MKRIGIIAFAIALMAATVTNVFEDLSCTEDEARENILASFGGGFVNTSYEVVKKAKALPLNYRWPVPAN